MFRCRFCMPCTVFEKVVSAVLDHDDYFKQKTRSVGKTGISVRVKVNTALRILAYGLLPDAADELAISETTARVTVKRLRAPVVETLDLIYLRGPTNDDIERMLKQADRRGTSALLASIECCKIRVEKLPNSLVWAVKE